MFKRILITMSLIHVSVYGAESVKESNLLPFGTQAFACTQAFSQSGTPRILVGDLMFVRVDVSHLLHDPMVSASDIQRLSSPYNYFEVNFSNSDAVKILTQQSRIYGPKNNKMEYIYLFQAIKQGNIEFTTSRSYQVQTGQQELGTHELGVIQLMIDFKNVLLEHGEQTPSFEEYINFRLPPSRAITAKIFSEMSNGEETKPFDERLLLAEQRIVQWRRSLTKAIYTNFRTHGNLLTFDINESKRSGVIAGKIHQLRFNQLPSELAVDEGDIIVVESMRPQEVVMWEGGHGYPSGAYAHRYDAPEIRGNGLLKLYTETLERAVLPNDHGPNHLKVYFLVESSNTASIYIGKPQVSHPYTPKQEVQWDKEIRLIVTPRLKDEVEMAATSNAVLPPVLRELSELHISKLPLGSPLGRADVKAISKYFSDLYQSKSPSPENETALIEVIRPFFGESENERVFFLRRAGLEIDAVQNLIAKVDFSAPNAHFFPKIMEVLGRDASIARIMRHLIKLQLED